MIWAIWARVAVPVGARLPSAMPPIRPAFTAQPMASAAQGETCSASG